MHSRELPAVPAERARAWVRHDDPERWTAGAQLVVLAMRRFERGARLEGLVLLAAVRVLMRRAADSPVAAVFLEVA